MKLSKEIQQSMDEEGEFQTDFDKYTDVEISIRRDLTYLSNFIEGKQTKKVTPPPPSPRGVRASSRINLPKFEIKKFGGDPTCWKSFIESFDAAVHSTMELTDIEKMNFLVNHVDGEAGNVIKGLLLSNDNCLVAKNMLEDRFGDPQMLISSHMAKLLSLAVVSDSANVKDLRQLYDEVETQVRSLSTLGLDPKSFGAMLTPVLFSKIPDEFKLVISRKFGKSLWDINIILEFYNLELTAREKVNFENTGTRTACSVPFTGASLLADGSRHIHGKGYKSDSSERPLHSRYGSSYGHKFEKSDEKPGCLFCGRNHFARS